MSAFTFRTKPVGMHANFATTCYRCRGEVTVSNGRPDRHDCRDNSKTAGELFEEVLAALGK